MSKTPEEMKKQKQEYNRRYRENKKKRKEVKIEKKEENMEDAQHQEETPPPTQGETLTLEEYVAHLVESGIRSNQKKKASVSIIQDPGKRHSNGYSSLVYLLPVLLPFIKAGGEFAMKYLHASRMPEEPQQLSLSQLLHQ